MSAIQRIAGLVLALAVPAVAAAQSPTPPTWTPEVSVSGGLGHVFRWEDRTYGDQPDLGGAVTMVYRSKFAIDFGFDRAIGLKPPRAPCGLVNVACVGIAHDGPRSVAVTSITLQYRFAGTRVRPYLLGGVGVLWSKSLHSLTRVQGPIAVVTESASSDRGFGPDLGAGVHVSLGRHLAASPEIRWLDAPWLSRQNLAVTRLVVRVSYTPMTQ